MAGQEKQKLKEKMINYPELKFSLDTKCIGDYRVTTSIRERLKLVVYLPESLFDEFESLDCGFLLLPKDFDLKTNDLIYLSVAFDDEYDDEFIDSGMSCLVYVSECFALNGVNFDNMQIISIGFSNFI